MSARGLARLAKVQAGLVRLAELRLAAAEQACRDLDAERVRLDAFVAEGEGAPLKEAALRALKGVGLRAAEAATACDAQRARLNELRRRDGAVAAASERAAAAARREAEARALVAIMEARAASVHLDDA